MLTIRDLKEALLREAIKELGGNPDIDLLPKARAMLEAGVWGGKLRTFEERIDKAVLDDDVLPSDVKALLDAWVKGITKGLGRFRAVLDRKTNTRKVAA